MTATPEVIRARLQAQAAQDATPISDAQANTVTALFGQYRLTPYKYPLTRLAPETHRRTTNTERRAILFYLTGSAHTHDLTAGWYGALLQWLMSSPAHAETLDELRAVLAAANEVSRE